MALKIIITISIFVIIGFVIKFSKAMKLNDRLSKYTVNNDKRKELSVGDRINIFYNKIRDGLAKSLKKSDYFKRRSKKYERYCYINNNPLSIFATKFCISFIIGIIYTLSSIYKSNFNPMILLLVMVIGYFIYNAYLMINEKIRYKNIESDLLKAIIIMNNAFKSGYNITQAIDFVSKDLTGPISEEFMKISQDLKYGLELKDVFDRFYDRVRIEDALVMSSSLSLLNLTGGNLVGIFNSIEKSFTNKKRLRDELNAMTSSSKLVYYILLAMPVIIVSILLILSPDYYAPLFANPIGYLIIIFSFLLYIGYFLIIRKILKVDAWKVV